jgi:hypothetical protein
MAREVFVSTMGVLAGAGSGADVSDQGVLEQVAARTNTEETNTENTEKTKNTEETKGKYII